MFDLGEREPLRLPDSPQPLPYRQSKGTVVGGVLWGITFTRAAPLIAHRTILVPHGPKCRTKTTRRTHATTPRARPG